MFNLKELENTINTEEYLKCHFSKIKDPFPHKQNAWDALLKDKEKNKADLYKTIKDLMGELDKQN